jgi:hypothetical protein
MVKYKSQRYIFKRIKLVMGLIKYIMKYEKIHTFFLIKCIFASVKEQIFTLFNNFSHDRFYKILFRACKTKRW